MKKILVTLTAVAVSALTMYGQSRVNFNNYVSGSAVTVGADNMGATGGAVGANVGANYSVQLLWSAGTFADMAAFLASNPQSSSPVAFFGVTGGSPGTDGAGLFDGGAVAFGGAAGTYTAMTRAWFNGGVNSTYAAAQAANANIGDSGLFQIGATVAPTPAPNTTFAAFTVGTTAIIPEPSTFVLAGLGLASLLVFRRRK